jgi:hypothetical protein
MKKHVCILSVGRALGLQIHRHCATCWRPENHRNGDAHPSLHFYERKNRVRCFVCDMRGGHSCIDLVMGVLGISFSEAVNWIADRFPIPNVKPGRPAGSRAKEPQPYRVGSHGSDLEVLVRSGMFGQFSPAERSILIVLALFRDAETGLTQLSYAAIRRYAGVSSSATISTSLKKLARLHAIEVHPGARVGITRECSCYRVTLEDEKFLAHCNEVYRSVREEVAQERAYRHELRAARQKQPRQRPPATLSSQMREKEQHPTCEGLNLSSPIEVNDNKSLQAVKREIRFPADRRKCAVRSYFAKPNSSDSAIKERRNHETHRPGS